jgi:hypothetical protein
MLKLKNKLKTPKYVQNHHFALKLEEKELNNKNILMNIRLKIII